MLSMTRLTWFLIGIAILFAVWRISGRVLCASDRAGDGAGAGDRASSPHPLPPSWHSSPRDCCGTGRWSRWPAFRPAISLPTSTVTPALHMTYVIPSCAASTRKPICAGTSGRDSTRCSLPTITRWRHSDIPRHSSAVPRHRDQCLEGACRSPRRLTALDRNRYNGSLDELYTLLSTSDSALGALTLLSLPEYRAQPLGTSRQPRHGGADGSRS